jgi:hypothetical protein
MKSARSTDKSGYVFNTRAWRVLLALVFALLLSFASTSPAAVQTNPESTYKKRSEAENASRYTYRRLEITSLVVIFVAGAGAAYWLFRGRKP